MERNINNNPTGKPYCCHSGCNRDATHEIQYSTGHFEDVTQSCKLHIDKLIKDDKQADVYFISPPTYNNGDLILEGDTVSYKDLEAIYKGSEMKIKGEAQLVFRDHNFFLEIIKDSYYSTFNNNQVELISRALIV